MAAPAEAEPGRKPQGGQPVDLGPLPNLIGFVLRRAQIAVFKDFYTEFGELDIRPTQYSVLTVIDRNPGLRPWQVAEVLRIKRTNFVVLLDTLESRGLTRRVRVPTDHRAISLYLTAAGESLLRRIEVVVAEHDARWAEKVGIENVPMLLSLLSRIAEG